MSAFQKCQPTAPCEAPSDYYTSPQFTFVHALGGNTPNKRIRSSQFPTPPRSTLGWLHHQKSIRSTLVEARSTIASVDTLPNGMPPLVLPCAKAFTEMKIRDPPPGVAPEEGITWVDTVKVVPGPCEPQDTAVLGSTPEMPIDHLPWCGTINPPSPPRLRAQNLPVDPANFELMESEFARFGPESFGLSPIKRDEEGEWSDDLEDAARNDGIGAFANASSSYLAYCSLDLDDSFAKTPETWGSAGTPKGTPGRARCEAMACSPIYQNLLSGSPLYGNSNLTATPLSSAMLVGTPITQANSVPRESHESVCYDDSSSDEDYGDLDLCSEDEDGCLDADEDNQMFDFSPAIHCGGDEGLRDMDHIYI
eukprot:TRINITY_DN38937_c0_g1_i2.p1 TRINITY_DN38937_c0_g1~~TRINITY_DN38937_c0_g1_i2.p1  ORF type:complete len:365 (+),score=26.93 TRINITY_DN38937_c0_g1_i2:71-1165(+)